MSGCPSDDELRRLGGDSIDASTFAAIEEHIEACRSCQERLEHLGRECPATRVEVPSVLARVKKLPEVPGFVVERELDRGGMGVVYLAREPSLERTVALKVIRGDPLDDPKSRRRWLAEARALSGLQHPNVVQIHRVNETPERLFLVLEYVPGGSLASWLRRGLPPRRSAARIVETIALTVEYLHRRGLRHLDLKPANILLAGEPDAGWDQVVPKVADFGIARRDGEPNATATVSRGPEGTPSYMAPEQVAGRRDTIGKPADIYGIGAILYHLLTGRPPFQSDSVQGTFDHVRNQEPVPPRRLDPTIPRDLETIALKSLAKEPSRRYESAEALADDLRRWLDGHPIAARPVSPVEQAGRWCRRNPALASMAACLILALVTGFWGMFGLWKKAEAERARVVAALRESDHDRQVAIEAMHRVGDSLANWAGDARLEDVVLQSLAQSFTDQHAGIRALTHGDAKVMASLAVIHRIIGMRLLRSGSPREGKEWLKKAASFRLASLEQEPHSQLMAGGLVWDVLLIDEASVQIGESDEVSPYFDRAIEVVMKTFKEAEQRRTDILRIADARWERLYNAASTARRDHNLKEACRIEEMLLTNAKLLVDSHPEDPRSHVMLSRAHHQSAKNAWQVNDMPAIQGALRLSLDAAIKALSLAPGDRSLHDLVEDRRSRLVGLASNH